MDIQESNKLSEEIKNLIQSLKSIDLETLKREGRDFDFNDVYPYVKKIYEAIDELDKSREWLNTLPLNDKQNLFNQLNSLNSIILQVKEFNPTQIPNPQEHRNNLAATLSNLYQSVYPLLIEPMKLESISRKSKNSAVSNVSKKAEEELSKIQEKTAEAESLLNVAKKVTVETGVTGYSKIFETQAGEHRRASYIWLGASIVVVAVLFIFLISETNEVIRLVSTYLMGKQTNINASYLFAVSLGKLFIASVGYYVLYQCIKNYNVNMHLHTLNKHRANVFNSFQSFARSADNPSVRDVITVKAAETIFSSGETGYLSGKDNSSKEGTEMLIPLLENLTKK